MVQQVEVQSGSSGHHMAVDLIESRLKKVLMVVANPTLSSNNNWPVGFWVWN